MKVSLALVAVALVGCPGGPKDVELAPPAAGFQLVAPGFDVPKGEEVQRCYFFRVPEAVDVAHLVAALNEGSHHMNVFRVKSIRDLDGEDGAMVDGGPCWVSSNWADWPLVVNSQEGGDAVDWKLPGNVVQRFTAGEKLMLQVHYVNAATQKTPGRGKAIVNFEKADGAGPFEELGTVFATNQQISVCPGKTATYETTCRFARQPVTIIAANGHFHSRGVKFTIAIADSANHKQGDDFYVSTEWADPPMSRDFAVQVPLNGGIDYSCSYAMPADQCGDPANQCCVTFGPHVETQEHCNAFVYYYPKQVDATCF